MFKMTTTLAALLAALAAGASAEPPTLEPLRRAAAGELATVVDGSIVRDGTARNAAAVSGALNVQSVPGAAVVEPGQPVQLSPRAVAAPPAPRREEKGFFAGLVSNPSTMAAAGALIGAGIGFLVGGGLVGALAGAAIGALLAWGLTKLLGGKKG